MLLGLGVVAIAALLLVWRTGNSRPDHVEAMPRAVAFDLDSQSRSQEPRGGIGPRPVDEPSRPPTAPASPRISPAFELEAINMAPSGPPPDDDPPEFANRTEEIAWYERKLEQALRMRESRKTFADRLPAVRARLEQHEDAETLLVTFERRKKIVEDNYDRAQRKVEEIERKLGELRAR